MKLLYIFIFFCIISFSSLSQVPEFTATVYDSAKSSGYYFLTDGSSLIILDRYGNMVYYKPLDVAFNFTLQKNGMMTYLNLDKTYILDSTFSLKDSIVCQNGYRNDTREMKLLENGNALVLGDEWVMMDIRGIRNWKKKFRGDSLNVRCSIFQELNPQKKVVFEWHAKDHLSLKDIDGFYADTARIMSLPQMNSLEKDRDGNYLVTCKWTNQVLKVSATDGSVIWRLGGNGNEFKFINCPVPFYGPRDTRRISNGNITLFDGGEHFISHGARAMEFVLDEKNKTATLHWSYTYDSTIYSDGRGNVQRLENGNTLVGYCYPSKGSLTFVVVNSEGEKIIQVNEIRSFRAFNYPSLPFQLHRPAVTCFDSLGVSYLAAEDGFQSYSWSDSSTTRIIALKNPGAYSVFVPYGEGGFISSEKFIVTDVSLPCGILPAKTKIKSKNIKNK